MSSSVGMMTFPTEWKVIIHSMVPVTTNQRWHSFVGVHIPAPWFASGYYKFIDDFPIKKIIKTSILHGISQPFPVPPTSFWLVVSTPLKNMSSSVGIIIPNIWKHKIHVPNQPVMKYLLVTIVFLFPQ